MTTGMQIAKQWDLKVKSARYSEWGNWYAPVKADAFPVALIDKNGYLLISSLEQLINTDGIKVKKQINIPDRISTLPGYVQVNLLGEERISENSGYLEGDRIRITINRYERDRKARSKCIEHYGAKCYACGFCFSDVYGPKLSGYIHIHHKIPISEIGAAYEVDPIEDLIPLCANCHAVVHCFQPALTVQALKSIIKNG